jgi:hypothetical protein
MLSSSWDSVKCDTFQNCFRKAGFIHSSSDDIVVMASSEPDPGFDEIDVGMTQDEFAAFCSVDSSLVCVSSMTEDEIIERVLAQRDHSQDAPEVIIESSDSEEEVPHITCNAALECVEKLKIFLAQVGDARAMCAIERVHHAVTSSSNELRKQKKMTDFFSNV